MKTEEELAWHWRTQRVWLALAVIYTLWPLVPLVGREIAAWLGGPHTWSGRIAYWFGAAFFWLLYITRPTRRNVALAVAIAVSLAELVLLLNRLHILRDQAARATNLGAALRHSLRFVFVAQPFALSRRLQLLFCQGMASAMPHGKHKCGFSR